MRTIKRSCVLGAISVLIALCLATVYPLLSSAQVNYPPSAGLGSQTVRTSHITNGTILNEDISTSAAISWRKMINNSTAATGFTVWDNGYFGFATDTPAMGFSVATSSYFANAMTINSTLQVNGNATTTGNQVISGNLTLGGSCTGCAANTYYTVASTSVQSSADTTRSTSQASLTKMKEILIQYPGTITVMYEYRRVSSGTGQAQTFKNGVAAGSLNSNNSNTNFGAVSENFSVNPGDLIQLYAANPNSTATEVRNFRIGYTLSNQGSPSVVTD